MAALLPRGRPHALPICVLQVADLQAARQLSPTEKLLQLQYSDFDETQCRLCCSGCYIAGVCISIFSSAWKWRGFGRANVTYYSSGRDVSGVPFVIQNIYSAFRMSELGQKYLCTCIFSATSLLLDMDAQFECTCLVRSSPPQDTSETGCCLQRCSAIASLPLNAASQPCGWMLTWSHQAGHLAAAGPGRGQRQIARVVPRTAQQHLPQPAVCLELHDVCKRC